MPIQPFLPSSRLNSGDGVFQDEKRSSVFFIFGRVSLRNDRTSPRSASASSGRWNGGNSSLGMDIVVLGGWMLPLCRLILGGATEEFRGSNAPPPTPPAAAPGGIRRRRARGRSRRQSRLLSRLQRTRRRSDGAALGADRR